MEKQTDNLINNALAIISTVGCRPSPIAEREAVNFLSGKKDRSAYCRVGSENNRLFFRVLNALSKVGKDFDIQSLSKLHAYLFEGLRPEAGKLRTAALQLEGSNFTDCSLIAGSLKRLINKMCSLEAAPKCSKEDFALQLTYYFSEMFLLQPFKHGTLVAQSVFFFHFAIAKGYRLNYNKCGGARLADAVKKAFFTDETSNLFLCLSEAITYFTPASETNDVRIVEAIPLKRDLKRDSSRIKTLVKSSPKREPPRTKNSRPVRQQTEITESSKAASSPNPTSFTATSETDINNDKRKLYNKTEQPPVSEKSKENTNRDAEQNVSEPEKISLDSTQLGTDVQTESNIIITAMENSICDDSTAFPVENKKSDFIPEIPPIRTIRTSGRRRGSISIANNLLEEIAASCADLIAPENLTDTTDETNTDVQPQPQTVTRLNPIPPIKRTTKRSTLETKENYPSTELANFACEPIQADFSKLSATTLKKAAKLKEKIEVLQQQLRTLLSESEE